MVMLSRTSEGLSRVLLKPEIGVAVTNDGAGSAIVGAIDLNAAERSLSL